MALVMTPTAPTNIIRSRATRTGASLLRLLLLFLLFFAMFQLLFFVQECQLHSFGSCVLQHIFSLRHYFLPGFHEFFSFFLFCIQLKAVILYEIKGQASQSSLVIVYIIPPIFSCLSNLTGFLDSFCCCLPSIQKQWNPFPAIDLQFPMESFYFFFCHVFDAGFPVIYYFPCSSFPAKSSPFKTSCLIEEAVPIKNHSLQNSLSDSR